MSDSIRQFLKQQEYLRRLIDPMEEARKLTGGSAIAEALGATSSLSQMFIQDQERHRQLFAIVDGYRFGGIGSEALLRMAEDAHQQHKLFGGAIEEAQRLGLLDRDTQFDHAVRAAVEASRAYEQIFQRPTSAEIIRLATEAIRSSSIVSHVFDEQERLSDLRARMEEMLSPWVNANMASASARAFADLQSIGKLVNQANSFEPSVAAMLRISLGDWRDPTSSPVESLINPQFRTSLYVERGFDQALTDFTAQAFDEGIEIALLWDPGDEERSIGRAENEEDEDGYVRARVAFTVLQQFEIAIRRFIVEAMRAAYGDEWAKRQLPSGMYDKWCEKKEAARKTGEGDRPLIDYADFTDYRLIIERKDNWNAVFRPIFGRPESVRESFQRLYPVRIATMHARVVTLDDHIYLLAETRRVLRAIRSGS
jgi:hypothetical protein